MKIAISLHLLVFGFVATLARFAPPLDHIDGIKHTMVFANCGETPPRPPALDCRWGSNLNVHLDQEILGVKIIAYKIRWANGQWSHWLMPGENDIDNKHNRNRVLCFPPLYNYEPGSLRRAWSYFSDHTHKFIYCGPLEKNFKGILSSRLPAQLANQGSETP